MDPNSSTYNGWTPLMISCSGDYIEIVKYLIEKGGVNTNQDEIIYAFRSAVEGNRLEVLKYLLDKMKSNLNDID